MSDHKEAIPHLRHCPRLGDEGLSGISQKYHRFLILLSQSSAIIRTSQGGVARCRRFTPTGVIRLRSHLKQSLHDAVLERSYLSRGVTQWSISTEGPSVGSRKIVCSWLSQLSLAVLADSPSSSYW